MTNRERWLTIVVGVLLLALVAYWGYGQVSSMFRRQKNIKNQLVGQLDVRRQALANARDVSKRLEEYESMSLPSNVEIARSQYQAWLSELLATAELTEPQVKVVSQRRLVDGSTALTCTLSGKGDLQQLAKLLYQFYAVKTIHRIRIMPIKPIQDTKLLDIDMTVDALIVSTAPRDKDFDTSPASQLAKLDWETVAGPVIQRNMLAPENNAPEMSSVSNQEIELGKQLTVSFKATDPDQLDKLTYRIIEGPDNARIDTDNGSVVWTPAEIGEYAMIAEVTDDGIPRKTDRKMVRISVSEPQVATQDEEVEGMEQLAFDDAEYTYFVAAVESTGQQQIWLSVRTKGTSLRLKVGDEVKIGSVIATISNIGQNSFEMEIEGERRTIRLGEPLVAQGTE